MIDLGGIFLLIVSFTGAIKGLSLPVWIPLMISLIAVFLLLYQGLYKHSQLIFIHAATVWVALTWSVGSAMKGIIGQGLLLQIPIGALLLVTPLAAIAPHQAVKRFNVASKGKKLELTRTDAATLNDWLKSKTMPQKSKEKKQNALELITFDLGEEINYENK